MDEKWLILYGNVKTEMDKFLTQHPQKLRNILNFKKLSHLGSYQESLSKIKQKQHHLLKPGQEVGHQTSRAALLYRLRSWYSKEFHLVTRPFLEPSQEFLAGAISYFEQSENNKSVFYGSLYKKGFQHLYHFFVLKTGRVVAPLEGYLPHQIYLLIIVDGQTVEVEPLG